MSEAREDLYDALERRHEEREKAADALAGVLGIREERPRDEAGRFSSADAGDRTPPPPPARRESGARLRDALLYGDAGEEYEVR